MLVCFIYGSYLELTVLFRPEKPIEFARMESVPYLGRFTAMAELAWQEQAKSWKSGQYFDTERISIKSGLLEMELRNGVRLVLEGPAEFQLDSLERCYCHIGRLSAEISPAGHGFEVVTPRAVVRDLGTAFVVDVDENGMEAHVASGRIQVSQSSRKHYSLSIGEALRIDNDGSVRSIVANPKMLVSRKKMGNCVSSDSEKRWEYWQSMFERDAHDPDLFLQLDFDRLHARKVGCRVVPGRWKGKKTVEFYGTNDHVAINAGETFHSMTLLAAVRLEGLDRDCNTIIATDRFSDREGFCWGIDGKGRLRFQVWESGSKTAKVFLSDCCFSRDQFGIWTDLAVTIDAKRKQLVQYMNGLPVSTVSLENVLTNPVENPTVGNWIREGHSPTRRQFQGRIDSVEWFSRPLTRNEIELRTF